MSNGKDTCAALKAVRMSIAEANDIPYQPHECTYEGECRGTCPACESEVRYLESQLAKRRSLGRTVAVAGVAASMAIGLCGCTPADVVDVAARYLHGGAATEGPLEGSVPAERDDCVPQGEPGELDGDVMRFPDEDPLDQLEGEAEPIPDDDEAPQP